MTASGGAALLGTLTVAAASVGSLHCLAPDHWVPFAAVARARGWTAGRTARITVACGVGHVTSSLLLAVLGLVLGIRVLQAFAGRLEAVAGVLLVICGLAYGAWGVRRGVARHFHGHTHAHYDHVHDPSRVTAWGLFAFFSADPCVAVIPLFIAAVPLGWAGMIAVAAVYEVATISTMVLLVLPARAGAAVLRFHWLDRYGDAGAGGLIAATGLVVMAMGW
jgi:hypothetical protein